MAIILLLPWAILAKGPPWINAGCPSNVWTRLGLIASFNKIAIAPTPPMSPAVTGVPE